MPQKDFLWDASEGFLVEGLIEKNWQDEHICIFSSIILRVFAPKMNDEGENLKRSALNQTSLTVLFLVLCPLGT